MKVIQMKFDIEIKKQGLSDVQQIDLSNVIYDFIQDYNHLGLEVIDQEVDDISHMYEGYRK